MEDQLAPLPHDDWSFMSMQCSILLYNNKVLLIKYIMIRFIIHVKIENIIFRILNNLLIIYMHVLEIYNMYYTLTYIRAIRVINW